MNCLSIMTTQPLCSLTIFLAPIGRCVRRRVLWHTPDSGAPQQLFHQPLELHKLKHPQIWRAENKNQIPAGCDAPIEQPNRLTNTPARAVAFDSLTNSLADHKPAPRYSAPAWGSVKRQ